MDLMLEHNYVGNILTCKVLEYTREIIGIIHNYDEDLKFC